MKYDKTALAALRGTALDMICKAKSGHPGMALSSAPLVYTLFTRHLVSDPKDPSWINRDRFVLSAGHASALLYATLHLAGYDIPLDELKRFRQIGSLTPGHPEVGHTPGVDATAGPLGQGIAQAVGLAMAESHLKAIYEEGDRIIDHYTYVLCGDGCLEEGISQEAISIAGVEKLNKLILLYDFNNCTLDGPLSNSSIEDTKTRFQASGWNVLEVLDGNSIDEIDQAITLAKEAKEKPTVIICHTTIGYGSPLAGSNKSHGKAFNEAEVRTTKENLGCDFPPFDIPQEAYTAFKETFIKRGIQAHQRYEDSLLSYKRDHEEDYQRFISFKDNDVRSHIFSQAPIYDKGFKDATRNTSQNLLNLVALKLPNLFGGSADVAESVKTNVSTFTDFTPLNRKGQNINFGIREFAMAGIQNGILLHGGLRTYIGCFLVFSDYMKAAIRMAAMEHLPAIYLFSHDSIAVGEDGPTHQPIEQLTMLRSIPNVTVVRPADAIECAAAYNIAFTSTDRPTCIILSRQNLRNNDLSSFDGTKKGGYVVSYEKERCDYTLIATGSEVNLAIDVQKRLLNDNIDTRVVSLPAFDLFDKQSQEYQDEVMNNKFCKRVFIEMGKGDCLYKYARHVISIDSFGLSASANDVINSLGFDTESIYQKVKDIIKG